MAFCTSCGAQLDTHAQFCVKCGTRQAAGVGGAVPARAAAPSSASNNALKVVLMVIAGVILLGVVGSIATAVFIHKKIRDAKVTIMEKGDKATIVTPMGTIHTEKDPNMLARDLGVDVYPGAKSIEGGSEVQSMGMHMITARFETSDPPDKVAAFYRQLFPKAIYSEANGEYNLVAGGQGSRQMTTIHIQQQNDRTELTIVNNSGKGMGEPN